MNREIDVHFTKLCKIMSRQGEIYREMTVHYKALNKPKTCAALETIKKIFDKLNSSYVHINSTFGAIFGTLSNQFYYEFESVSYQVSEVVYLRKRLTENETKLIEKKNLLFKEQQIQKWELDTESGISVDELLKDNEKAMKEILPKETKSNYRLRKICGFLYNRVAGDFDRLCNMYEDKISLSILFMARMCRDMAKEVNFNRHILGA